MALLFIAILMLCAGFDACADPSKFVYLFKIGGKRMGSADGEFSRPHGADIDSDGNLYVADSDNERIEKFTKGGKYLSKMAVPGGGFLRGLAVDKNGNVYVGSDTNPTIWKFDKTGSLVQSAKIGSLAIRASNNFLIVGGGGYIDKHSFDLKRIGQAASTSYTTYGVAVSDKTGNVWGCGLAAKATLAQYSPGGGLIRTFDSSKFNDGPAAQTSRPCWIP